MNSPHKFEGKHSELTRQIIGAFYRVYNNLGYGFLEKIYEKAMSIKLTKLGLVCKTQEPIKVYYEGIIIGDFFTDLIVNDLIIVELKTAEKIIEEHQAQLLNYLKATQYEVGLLLNFGPKPAFDRRIFENARKGPLTWTTRE